MPDPTTTSSESSASSPSLNSSDVEMLAEAQRLIETKKRPDKIAPLGDSIVQSARMISPVVQRKDLEDLVEFNRRQAHAIQMFGCSFIPERYRAAELPIERQDLPANYLATVAKLSVMPNDKESRIVMLCGNHGAGKTWIACAIARQFCRMCRPALYARAIDFFIDIKSTFGAAAKENQREVENRYRRPHLLVLDEIHVRSDTPWENQVLMSMVDARYADQKSTILIGNLSADEMRTRLPPGVLSRSQDGGGFINCDWASLRGRKL